MSRVPEIRRRRGVDYRRQAQCGGSNPESHVLARAALSGHVQPKGCLLVVPLWDICTAIVVVQEAGSERNSLELVSIFLLRSHPSVHMRSSKNPKPTDCGLSSKL